MNTSRTFELADQEGCDTFEKEVMHILRALGHPEALVTDESQVGDFCIHIFGAEADPEIVELNQKILAAVGVLMGRSVHESELVWEMARELAAGSVVPVVH